MSQQFDHVKLQIYTPVDAAESVRRAVGDAGAGIEGNYEYCSSTFAVTGRFLPTHGAKPAVGKVGKIETVEEVVVEVRCHVDQVDNVLREAKLAHPYETPVIDILPLIR